ncbi:hypothetical protein Cadr_000027618 [Camelus dromedarius]|uniref:Uncharacterized protein n=1 Tax=Camelus dromedarius TaxID=9838 RepID=A0A5N4CBF5_CAMDR|nr:hypothetical protein Cadr_000027618 [Camelus dromedarius]
MLFIFTYDNPIGCPHPPPLRPPFAHRGRHRLAANAELPIAALAQQPHTHKGWHQGALTPQPVPAPPWPLLPERASKPLLCVAASPASPGRAAADSAEPRDLPEARGELARRLQTRVFGRGDFVFRADFSVKNARWASASRAPSSRSSAKRGRRADSEAGDSPGEGPTERIQPQDKKRTAGRGCPGAPTHRWGSPEAELKSPGKLRARGSEGMRVTAEVGGGSQPAPESWAAYLSPFSGSSRARSSSSGPRLLPSCPLAAPPRLGSGGTIREAPGFFPAPELSPRPAPGSSAHRRFPSPRQGAPEGGGVCATCTSHWGLGDQAPTWQRGTSTGRLRWCLAVTRLAEMFTPDGQAHSTRLWAAPSPPASSAGSAAQGAGSRRLLAFYSRVARPGGGVDLHPGRRRGWSRGVNKLPSCCQLISKDQGQVNVCFPPSRAYTVLSRTQLTWRVFTLKTRAGSVNQLTWWRPNFGRARVSNASLLTDAWFCSPRTGEVKRGHFGTGELEQRPFENLCLEAWNLNSLTATDSTRHFVWGLRGWAGALQGKCRLSCRFDSRVDQVLLRTAECCLGQGRGE